MTSIAVRLSPEERIVTSVRALRAAQSIGVPILCARLGISRATWFKRMNDGQFTIGEVVSLSELFGVSVQAMLDGIGSKATGPNLRPVLRSIPGEGRKGTSDRPLMTLV